MTGNLEAVLLRLSQDHGLLNSVEEATKQGAVLPVLSVLGWNCFDIQEVIPEFSVGSGRIDYCLRVNQKNAVFIEVKRATEDLERHEKQLLEYSFTYGVDIAVLTNGLTWWFYLPLLGGNWQQRKFISIDIRQQKIENSTNYFNDFLNKEAILNGTATKKAKDVKESREKIKLIKKAIPDAWKQLIEEPDEMLLEIFADKVEGICGYSPDLELLTEFIINSCNYPIHNKSDQEPSPSPTPKRKYIRPNTPEKQSSYSTRQKGASVLIGDKSILAETVGDLYYQALKYLCDNNFISKVENKIPFATSSKRFLIAKEPIHQRGNSFRCPIEYNGYYMETHKNYEQALKHLEDLVKECGLIMKY